MVPRGHGRPCVPGVLRRQQSWELPAGPEAAGRARRHVRRQLRGWDLSPWGAIAELLVSELVTNALRHGGQPMTLRMVRCFRGVLIEVSDSGADLPRAVAAGPASESGRGLRLVEALSQRWGVRRDARGKVVWFRLADTADRRNAHCAPESLPQAGGPGGGWTGMVARAGVSAWL